MNWITDFQFDTLTFVTGVNVLADLLGAWALLFWSGQRHKGLLALGLVGWLGGAAAAMADQLLFSLLLQLLGVFATSWQPREVAGSNRVQAERGMSAFLMRQHDRAGNVTGQSLVMPPRNAYARRKLQSLSPQQMEELTHWCARMVQRSRCLSVDLSCWPGWDEAGSA